LLHIVAPRHDLGHISTRPHTRLGYIRTVRDIRYTNLGRGTNVPNLGPIRAEMWNFGRISTDLPADLVLIRAGMVGLWKLGYISANAPTNLVLIRAGLWNLVDICTNRFWPILANG